MITDEFILFLQNSQEKLIREFRKGVILSKWDIRNDALGRNDTKMIRLIIGYLKDEITLEDITRFAQKVAIERIQADINIGDFVYNVSLGRKILYEHIYFHYGNQHAEGAAFRKMNECFDHFLVEAVTHYTEIKNSNLAEKQQFIDQTHKERLTILGQMSSSFVHEFRNPLTSVMGFTQLLKQEYPNLPYLDVMMNELQQLNYRVTQFLLISKKGRSMLSKETVHLASLFDEILSFLYPQIVDVNVEVLSYIEPLIHLNGYREELRQVFINIIVNAIDAVCKRNMQRFLLIHARQEDDAIVISISNNGHPIPQDMLAVMFEPFVTTKDLGTGIGLYICKQMIERHEGTISCESDEVLTTFTIRFPVQVQEEKEA